MNRLASYRHGKFLDKNVLNILRALYEFPKWHWNVTISRSKHIFVCGPPRSGTTLTYQIIRSNTYCNGIDEETYFFCRRQFRTSPFPPIAQDAFRQIRKISKDKVALFDNAVLHLNGKKKYSLKKRQSTHFIYIFWLIIFQIANLFFYAVIRATPTYRWSGTVLLGRRLATNTRAFGESQYGITLWFAILVAFIY